MSQLDWEIWNKQRLNGTLCDVVLKAGGAEFTAHKNVLSACSEYFRVLMTSHYWPCSLKNEYSFPDVSKEIMDLIVKYAYSRKVIITPENAWELLVAANQLGVLGIVKLCCNFVANQLCPHNCIGICRFAEQYCCHELYQQAYFYILQHFEEVVQEPVEEFLELTLPQLCDLLDKDELNVKQEETVFEAILNWINHDPELRSGCIPILLPKVRMGLIDCNYFLENVKDNPLVSTHLQCHRIIDRVLNWSSLEMTETCQPRIPHSILLAIGGWSINGPTNAIEVYDSRACRWMPIPWTEEARAYHGIAFLNGYLYIVGGFSGTKYFNTVHRYNPISHTWEEVGHLQFFRCYVSVVVLDGHIYAIGGFTGRERLNSVERYDPISNQWSLVPSMKRTRSDAGAATLNNKIYICGGYDGLDCLSTAECYDPEINEWNFIASMRTRRSGLAVAAFKEQVFAVGGFDAFSRLQTAEVYDPELNIWTAISSMVQTRSNFGIAVLEDQLYVAGGFNGSHTISNVECYNATTGEWYNVEDMYVKRSGLKCCVLCGLPNISEYCTQYRNL